MKWHNMASRIRARFKKKDVEKAIEERNQNFSENWEDLKGENE